MGRLKLTIEHGESVTIGEARMLNKGKRAVLEVTAPESMEIRRWDADGSPVERNLAKANKLTPDMQRAKK